jgi:hypothetical protein
VVWPTFLAVSSTYPAESASYPQIGTRPLIHVPKVDVATST